MKSPAKFLRSLLDDYQRLQPGSKGHEMDYIHLVRRFEHEGLSFLTKTLGTLCDAFLEGISTGTFTCPRNFKPIPRGRIPRLFSGIFCEVFDPSSGRLKDDYREDAVLSVYQLLAFFKKAAASASLDSELEEAAVTDFFDAETQILDLSQVSGSFRFAIERVSRFLLPHLSMELENSDPKHGPGAVYEGYTQNQKWKSVTELLQVGELLPEFGYDTIGVDDRIPSEEFLSRSCPDQLELDLRQPDAARDVARLVCVPKHNNAARTITVEPVGRQFVQQFCNTALRNAIAKCPVLSSCLDLTDQSKNQVLALEGSRDNTYATIDLKSASDLLSNELVMAVFSRHQWFSELLVRCRSSSVERATRSLSLKKYAGMGNATTFPIQSIVFAVIAIASILERDGKSVTYREVMRVSRTVRCYGDDIICRTSDADCVVLGLQSVGLRINTKKSYLSGRFRESCGTDAYAGVDITPTKLRFFPEVLPHVPSSLASLVSTSNQLWLKCWYATSTLIQKEVEKFSKRKLPFLPEDSAGLGWQTRHGHRSYRKWNRHHQLHKIYAPVVVPVRVRDPIDGYAGLVKSFLVPIEGRPVGHDQFTTKRHQTKVVWKWVTP